jgi:hypothetical protein
VRQDVDPLVASAEDAVRRAEAQAGAEPTAEPADPAEPAEPAEAEAADAAEVTQPAPAQEPVGEAPETGEGQEPQGTAETREAPEAQGSHGVRDFPDDTTMELLLPAQAPAPAPTPTPEETPAPPEAPASQEPSAPEHPAPADDPYTIGPDVHERTADEGAEPAGGPVTAKGLPKRTPKITTPAAVPRPRTAGSVDAEALRRRLGGFRRGAEAGRRDVEAEIAERTDQNQVPPAAGTTEEATGGTVEEASS